MHRSPPQYEAEVLQGYLSAPRSWEVCLVSLKEGGSEALQVLKDDLMEWMAHGLSEDGKAHQYRATALKRSKGMRVKG